MAGFTVPYSIRLGIVRTKHARATVGVSGVARSIRLEAGFGLSEEKSVARQNEQAMGG
jgi:hypothetical protein